nr:hypothetical protein [Sphingomonas sp.]
MILKSFVAAGFAALSFAAAAPSAAFAQDYAASALNTPDASALGSYGAQTSIVDDAKVPGGKALRVEAVKGTNPWDAAVSSSVKQAIKAGDPLVLAFWVRLVSGENGATSATLPWASVSLGSAPWTPLFGGPVTIGPEWKLVEVRGSADKDYAPGTLNAGIQVANAKQTIDFGPLYVAKTSGGTTTAPVPASAPAPAPQKSALASLDPATIANSIVNDPGAPQVNGADARLVDDPRVTGGKAMRVQVPRKGKNAWDISIASTVKKPVKAGDTLVLVFPARLEKGENGATAATLPWNAVSLTSPPWSGVLGGPADIGPDWKMVEIRGKADKDYAAGALSVGIQLATARQTVDVGPIIVLDLGQ